MPDVCVPLKKAAALNTKEGTVLSEKKTAHQLQVTVTPWEFLGRGTNNYCQK